MTPKINVMICGSQKFDDPNFVFETLKKFFELTHGNIGTIVTSKFSGACSFAEQWVNKINESLSNDDKIKVHHYVFDDHLIERNSSLYEQIDLPKFVLQNDEFFIKGKELVQHENINLVIAFPNKEGKLGAASQNIIRFTSLSGAKVFNCAELYQQMLHQKEEVKHTSEISETPSVPFENRHPTKRTLK